MFLNNVVPTSGILFQTSILLTSNDMDYPLKGFAKTWKRMVFKIWWTEVIVCFNRTWMRILNQYETYSCHTHIIFMLGKYWLHLCVRIVGNLVLVRINITAYTMPHIHMPITQNKHSFCTNFSKAFLLVTKCIHVSGVVF